MRPATLVVCLLAIAACGSGNGSGATTSTPTAPTAPTSNSNRNPTITSVTVFPAFGVSGMTSFSFAASATDPDGDALTYEWTYSGATSAGPNVAATLNGDGSVNIQLTVTDGKGGSATDARAVILGNMTGRWTFIFTDRCGPYFPPVLPILTLTQTGRAVTGDLVSPGNWCNVPAGQTGKLDPAAPMQIDDKGNITAGRLKIGSYVDTFMTGQMDSTGRKITGIARFNYGYPDGLFEMIKQ